MQPLAEARVEKMVPMKSRIISHRLPVTRAASNSGVPACPRYSQDEAPSRHTRRGGGDHQSDDAGHGAIGRARDGERTSSAAWVVPSMPR